jgi:hypothetical protein
MRFARNGVQDRRQLIRWSAVVLLGSYFACLLVAFLKCIPFEHQWQINPEPPSRYHVTSEYPTLIDWIRLVNCQPAIAPIQTVFVMVMNTLTDFYLMAIPVPVSLRYLY